MRIAVLSVPLFMHGGLEVNERWSPFPDEPTEKQRAALRDFHGRFIRIHSADLGELAKHDLGFVDEHTPLADITKKPGGDPAPVEPRPEGPKPEPQKKKSKTDA